MKILDNLEKKACPNVMEKYYLKIVNIFLLPIFNLFKRRRIETKIIMKTKTSTIIKI